LKNNNIESPSIKKPWQTLARVIALVFVIGITIYILVLPEEQTEKIASFGYLGIFLISILANATIIIPAPGLVLVFGMGAKFSPLLVGLASGAGATIGELSGYLAGFSGQAIIENQKRYDQIVGWMKRNGPLTISLLAFIPNPFFDIAGMVSGAFRMPVFKFLFFALIGKILKMLVFAYAGAGILDAPWLENLVNP
jgi:uncharacterized membrane protein YdjX (TVP38/TMEM64 family)